MKETIVFLSIVLGGLLLWFVMRREKPPRYRKKLILTGSELEFFQRLQQALPECMVCPQIAMSALIEPLGTGMARQAALAHIEGKRAGYAVFGEDMRLVAVVELDYRSRTSRRDAARDAYLNAAGIRTVRFNARSVPSDVKIRSSVYSRDGVQISPHVCWDSETTDIEFKRPQTPWRNTLNAHI